MKKKSIGFYLRIYRKILVQDLKSKMSYRADFIISTIGMVFTNIAGFVSFWILFRNFPSINGWDYYEMLFLYGFSLVSLTPVQCLFDNNWSLRMYVHSGDFIKYCFRPINLFFYFQSEVFDIKGLGQLAFGLGTLIYAWIKIGLACTPLMIIKTVVFLITASLVMIAVQNAAAATCFWMTNSFYVLDLSMKFKDYA
ncbi:MAG: ABC-2 family transporter protein, partial [Lachnospiraceae bacterium]|nr:ABC-2 family transporter protein [Lachnospiraceae bacterium]